MRKQLNGHVVKDEDLWLYSFFDLPAFSPQMVRDALEELPEPAEQIRRFLEGKLRGRTPDEKEKKRLCDALLRRGFSWSDVGPALRELGAETEE